MECVFTEDYDGLDDSPGLMVTAGSDVVMIYFDKTNIKLDPRQAEDLRDMLALTLTVLERDD